MRFSTGDAPSRSLQLGVKNPKVAGFKRTQSFMSTAGLTHLPDIRGSTQIVERPVIMVIDDEPDALAAMLDALTRRFGGDYRVVPHLPRACCTCSGRQDPRRKARNCADYC